MEQSTLRSRIRLSSIATSSPLTVAKFAVSSVKSCKTSSVRNANECDAILDLQCSQDNLRVCGLHTLIDNGAGTRCGRKIRPLPIAIPVQEEASPRVLAFRSLLGDAT